MISKTKKLMGTFITINIYDKNIKDFSLINKAFDIFKQQEKKFSRFDKNSLLSQLNKKKKLIVDKDFLNILKLSKFFYQKTNWYFNPLVNLSTFGYSQNFEKWIFNKKQTKVDLDLDSIQIDKNKIILKENQNLDFGGIVKWWTVDLVAKFLKQNQIKYFLIDAWWDIYWTSKYQKPFFIKIDNTNNILQLQNKAICTSWIYKRKWKLNKEYHHILNPKTKKNNFDIKSITIVSDYAIIWDTYATACIAMWEKKAKNFLKKENIFSIIIKNNF